MPENLPRIREATELDAPAVIQMAHRFVASTGYQPLIRLDPARLHAMVRGIAANPDAVCLIAEDDGQLLGAIAVLVSEHPLSGDRVASGLVWWADPEAHGSVGVLLYQAAVAWAHARGAVLMQMIAPTDRGGQFYQSHGFTQIEAVWQRRMT